MGVKRVHLTYQAKGSVKERTEEMASVEDGSAQRARALFYLSCFTLYFGETKKGRSFLTGETIGFDGVLISYYFQLNNSFLDTLHYVLYKLVN